MIPQVKSFLNGLGDLWEEAKKDLSSAWDKNRIFVIVFGALILAVKFRDVLINLIVAGAKQKVAAADKKDQQLAAEVKTESDQADTLVQQAAQLPQNTQPVTDDHWYEKEGDNEK